jgi:hypothetical protein
MEKCGMRYDGIQEHYGMPLVIYAITDDEYANGAAGVRKASGEL